MTQSWERVGYGSPDDLSALPSESRTVIVISTHFDPEDKLSPAPPLNYELTDGSAGLLNECARILEFGGLLFVYGLPHHLSFFGQHLYGLRDDKMEMLFKYWITLDIDEARGGGDSLNPSSQGLLVFLKSKIGRRAPSQFHLNTSAIRSPHAYCAACGQNVKDWGGKKHLMNPDGTSLSDVWRDLPRIQIRDHVTPDFVLRRIFSLTHREGAEHLHITQNTAGIRIAPSALSAVPPNASWPADDWDDLNALELNEVYRGESISFLDKISVLYPQGIFDMAFADPPYNLSKSYDKYKDALEDEHYIRWCNRWLEGMVKTLKPGGSLLVLNLPKWAIHHAAYLNRRLEFRHWVTWDALSDPRGKIMPAHYALLYYTKPGATPIFNYSTEGENGGQAVLPPDSPKYCLRASCIKKRKKLGDDEKVPLSDVWFDIHRIKHKRDRDAHPCQLPAKLLERLVLLTTNEGGIVFDPFCGAGTTAVAASKLERNFVVVDIDPIAVLTCVRVSSRNV